MHDSSFELPVTFSPEGSFSLLKDQVSSREYALEEAKRENLPKVAPLGKKSTRWERKQAKGTRIRVDNC